MPLTNIEPRTKSEERQGVKEESKEVRRQIARVEQEIGVQDVVDAHQTLV